MFGWDDLDYFRSEQWRLMQEELDTRDKNNIPYNPKRELIFAALDAVPYDKVKVMFMGQDPYPNPGYCIGKSFSIPKGITKYPPTLVNIYKELRNDLHYTEPRTGNLETWEEQGVLLWNAIPTCKTWLSLSDDAYYWHDLTKEIVQRLSEKGIVFVFIGGVARRYAFYVDQNDNYVIEVSHPSPRASNSSHFPFFGSRIFSRVNDHLSFFKERTIDWSKVL